MSRSHSHSVHHWILLTTIAVAIALTTTACRIESQKPAEIYSDRETLTPELDALANPRPSANHLARQDKFRAEHPARVAVAVIDCGVDYLHPDLYKQVRFDRDSSGQATGAGHDVMGGDEWAHPTLVSAMFSSLTASALDGDRLRGVSGDPSAWLLATGKTFWQALARELAAEPRLKGTLFEKNVREESYSLFAVREFVRKNEATCLKQYNEAAKSDDLIAVGKPSQKVADYYKGNLETLRQLQEDPWVMEYRDGMSHQYEICRIAGGNAFVDVLKRAYQATDAAHGIEAAFARFSAYRKILNGTDPVLDSDTETLTHAWHDLRFNYAGRDPLREFSAAFCENAAKGYASRVAALQGDARLEAIRGELARQKSVIRAGLPLYAQVDKAAEIAKKTDAWLAKAGEAERYVLDGGASYVELLACDPLRQLAPLNDPQLDRINRAQFSPLLHAASASSTHGTHVAGIIARQSPAIEVVPVRVTTASPVFGAGMSARIRQNFEAGFRAWASTDDVKEVVERRARAILKSDGVKLDEEFGPYLDANFKEDYLEYYFFYEILDAIEYVGKHKIKVANLSLGTSFVKAVSSSTASGEASARKDFVRYFIYEYLKFAVGSAIKKHAPQALFVIASGNDGAWVDGQSRSALPCDLSSPVFAALEDERGRKLFANNSIDNILCVGSIDPQHQISSFMNLPLTDVPFVLSYGESIYSTISRDDCEGAEQLVTERFGKPQRGSSFKAADEDPAFDAFFRAQGWIAEDVAADDPDLDRMRSRAHDRFEDLVDGNWTKLIGATTVRACKSSHRPKARLSGTSMATPAVAGYVGRVLADEALKRNLTADELWSHPDFTPARIIESIRETSPRFGGRGILSTVPKVVDIQSWDPSARRKAGKLLASPVLLIDRAMPGATTP